MHTHYRKLSHEKLSCNILTLERMLSGVEWFKLVRILLVMEFSYLVHSKERAVSNENKNCLLESLSCDTTHSLLLVQFLLTPVVFWYKSSSRISRASPKSVTLQVRFSPINTFLAAKSRWTIYKCDTKFKTIRKYVKDETR